MPLDDVAQVMTDDSKSKERHVGLAPIFAYTPTYGWVTGAGAFVFPKAGRQGLDSHIIVVALPKNGEVHSSFAYQDDFNDQWGFNLEGVATNFFTSYYGEGDETSPHSLHYKQFFYRAHEGIVYNFNRQQAIEFFAETRSRTDDGLTTNPSIHLVPNETRTVMGACATHDSRDSIVDTRRGHFALLQVQGAPSDGATAAFAQLELEFRYFIPLSERATFASRFEAASSTGTASYDFRYNLGGLERLRGYLHNRFRGDQYYLGGGELRQDVWGHYLQVVGFADIGDIKDQRYVRPRWAYGTGIRIGLPPDWDMKFRIDFARGDDQSGIFATFGQAY